MSTLLQTVRKSALTHEAMHKVYDDAVKGIGEQPKVHARHILIRAAAGDDKASKEAEDKIKAVIVRLNKGEISPRWRRSDRGPLRQDQWRRSRLFHQGADGAGIRRRRLQARQGSDLRPGEDPVRLARHQVEDKRMNAAAELRRGQAADRAIVVRKAQADLVTKLRGDAKIEKFYKPAEPPKAEPKKDEPAKSKRDQCIK